jgi:hypothetical protein
MAHFNETDLHAAQIELNRLNIENIYELSDNYNSIEQFEKHLIDIETSENKIKWINKRENEIYNKQQKEIQAKIDKKRRNNKSRLTSLRPQKGDSNGLLLQKYKKGLLY